MDDENLPDELGFAAWWDYCDELKTRQLPLEYEQLLEMARLSPYLRIAFEPDPWTDLDYESAVHFHARSIARTHGLYERDEPTFKPTEKTFRAFVENAKVDRFHFDALKRAAGMIVGAHLPLDTSVAWWLQAYLMGHLKPPKRRKGPDPFRNQRRDYNIVRFLERVEAVGGKVTENVATYSGETACHAIVEVWGDQYEVPTAKRLMNIWSERERT